MIFALLNCLYLDPWGFFHLSLPTQPPEEWQSCLMGNQHLGKVKPVPVSMHKHRHNVSTHFFHNNSKHFITDHGAQSWKCTIQKVNMLNYFKTSLNFLHIKRKRARTRNLEYFGFYFGHFKLTFSTLGEETHEIQQHRGEANSRLKQGKGTTVPAKSSDSWEGTLAALGLTQSTPWSLPHEPWIWALPSTAGEGPVLRFRLLKSCATHSNRKPTMHQICCCAEQRRDASLRHRL